PLTSQDSRVHRWQRQFAHDFHSVRANSQLQEFGNSHAKLAGISRDYAGGRDARKTLCYVAHNYGDDGEVRGKRLLHDVRGAFVIARQEEAVGGVQVKRYRLRIRLSI